MTLKPGDRVKPSFQALRPARERIGTYGGSKLELHRRWYREAASVRGTVTEANDQSVTVQTDSGSVHKSLSYMWCLESEFNGAPE